MKTPKKDENRDRAELRYVTEIADGEYNREFVIKATEEGLRG